MMDNQAKLTISPVKTGIWFAFPTIPSLLIVCLLYVCGAISDPRYIASFILIFFLDGICPVLFTYFIGAFIGKILLQQQSKLVGMLSGPSVAVLTGIVWAIWSRMSPSFLGIFPWEPKVMGEAVGAPGVAEALGRTLIVCAFIVYVICEILIGILLTFFKKLIIEK